jgi:hypothetical protein
MYCIARRMSSSQFAFMVIRFHFMYLQNAWLRLQMLFKKRWTFYFSMTPRKKKSSDVDISKFNHVIISASTSAQFLVKAKDYDIVAYHMIHFPSLHQLQFMIDCELNACITTMVAPGDVREKVLSLVRRHLRFAPPHPLLPLWYYSPLMVL